jgi:hypothetical protein
MLGSPQGIVGIVTHPIRWGTVVLRTVGINRQVERTFACSIFERYEDEPQATQIQQAEEDNQENEQSDSHLDQTLAALTPWWARIPGLFLSRFPKM